MSKDGRVKTTYDFNEAVYESYVHVQDKKTGKSFYIVYQSNYFLGKAIQKIKKSRTLTYLGSNYKMY